MILRSLFGLGLCGTRRHGNGRARIGLGGDGVVHHCDPLVAKTFVLGTRGLASNRHVIEHRTRVIEPLSNNTAKKVIFRALPGIHLVMARLEVGQASLGLLEADVLHEDFRTMKVIGKRCARRAKQRCSPEQCNRRKEGEGSSHGCAG